MLHAREDYNGRVVDAQQKIPEDEPVFLLRGQDTFSIVALDEYADNVEMMLGENNPIVIGARMQVERFKKWQAEHDHKDPDMAESDVLVLDNETCPKCKKTRAESDTDGGPDTCAMCGRHYDKSKPGSYVDKMPDDAI